MWYQAIPFCLITILLVLVIARASKTSLLSIFTLGVIAINFLCAVFLHLHPRSGRPFVSLSAMVFFGVAYGILCLPLLFVKRQRERAKSGPPCELSTRMFLVLSTALIVVTLPVSLYDLWIGVKGLYTYATSGMSREAYRRAYAIKEVGGVQELCFILESFSYCALFLAAVGLVHFSRFRFVNVLLCIGGLAPAFWSYSIVARNVAFQMVLFYGLAVVVLGSSFGQCGRLWFVRIFFRPEMVCFLSVTVLPFVLITVLRFVPALAPLEYKKVIASNGTAKPVVVKKDGKAVALPQCEKEGNAMHFFLTEKESELENGRFNGIFEPKKGLLKAQATKKTLILVPALAYGRNGSRLGKGMGFYDRFLAESKGVPVGLCFEENLAEALPETGLDRRVRIIITENETLFIN